MPAPLIVATPLGPVARARAELVVRLLRAAWPDHGHPEVVMVPDGGGDPSSGANARVAAARRAVLDGRADIAVHAFGDLPTEVPDELAVRAVPRRADAREALVSRGDRVFEYLPDGARVGADGARRRALLLRRRSDLVVVPVAGDVDEALAMVDGEELDAAVLPAADLEHVGRADRVTEAFDIELMIPEPAQAALALEAGVDDSAAAELLAPLHDPDTANAVTAERACLGRLAGGRRAPVGVHAVIEDESLLMLGIVLDPDGRQAARLRWMGRPAREAEWVGDTFAELLLAAGAREILAEQPAP